jgi:Flp pilus assembly pilin Flp
MLMSTLKRFIREEDGMEMVEWSIVGIVFAVAAAAAWTLLDGRISNALTQIGDTVDPGGAP